MWKSAGLVDIHAKRSVGFSFDLGDCSCEHLSCFLSINLVDPALLHSGKLSTTGGTIFSLTMNKTTEKLSVHFAQVPLLLSRLFFVVETSHQASPVFIVPTVAMRNSLPSLARGGISAPLVSLISERGFCFESGSTGESSVKVCCHLLLQLENLNACADRPAAPPRKQITPAGAIVRN